MDTISIIIIVLLTGVTLTGILVWFYIHHKKLFKKAATIIIAGTLLGGGGLLLIPSDIITSTPTIGNHLFYSASALNAFFETNTTVHYSQIILDSSYTKFNNTKFIVSSPNRINITLMYIAPNTSLATVGSKVIDLYANTTSGLTTFNIYGLKKNHYYNITRNGVRVNYTKSDSLGTIIFKNSVWTAPLNKRFKIYDNRTFNATIRTYGVDYFTWLGVNTSAYYVYKNITGLNEATEYVSILNNAGAWSKYYGDRSGTNFSIHTFDVVRTYMDDATGNITLSMRLNPNVNYDASRTVMLKKVGNGYNYTGYTPASSTTLSSINASLSLATGYYIGLWNRTTFTFNYWISGFGITDKTIVQYNVIMSKINVDKTWVM